MKRKPHKPKKGHYYVLSPIDLAMLAALPTEGQMLGWHPIADTTTTLAEKLNKGMPREGWATTSQITGRIVSMHKAGYVTRVKLLSGTGGPRTAASGGGYEAGMGWQRTAKGEEFYEATTGERVPGITQKQREAEAEEGGN